MRAKFLCQAITYIFALLSLLFFIVIVPVQVPKLFDAYPQVRALQLPFFISIYMMAGALFYCLLTFIRYLRVYGQKERMVAHLTRLQHSIVLIGLISFLTTTILAQKGFAHPAIYMCCMLIILALVTFFISTLGWRIALQKSLQKSGTK